MRFFIQGFLEKYAQEAGGEKPSPTNLQRFVVQPPPEAREIQHVTEAKDVPKGLYLQQIGAKGLGAAEALRAQWRREAGKGQVPPEWGPHWAPKDVLAEVESWFKPGESVEERIQRVITQPTLGPPEYIKRDLYSELQKYYKHSPGGLERAVEQANLQRLSPLQGFADYPISMEALKEKIPMYLEAPDVAGAGGGTGRTKENLVKAYVHRLLGVFPKEDQEGIPGHELTHVLQELSLAKKENKLVDPEKAWVTSQAMIKSLGGDPNKINSDVMELFDPKEMEAYMADIKRDYLMANPGTKVETMEEAGQILSKIQDYLKRWHFEGNLTPRVEDLLKRVLLRVVAAPSQRQIT